MATLTRKDMETILRQGGTVLFDGRIIGDFNDLPTEADLAGTDTEAIKAAEENIDNDIKRLLAEKQKIAKAKAEAEKTAKSGNKSTDSKEKEEKPKNLEEASQMANAPNPPADGELEEDKKSSAKTGATKKEADKDK